MDVVQELRVLLVAAPSKRPSEHRYFVVDTCLTGRRAARVACFFVDDVLVTDDVRSRSWFRFLEDRVNEPEKRLHANVES